MIKPDAVENGHIGNIINMITQAGFSIKAMKYTRLTEAQAKEFYEVHAERPFYGELVEYMTSGPIVAAILEKENAMADFRALIGSTDQQRQQMEPSVSHTQKVKVEMLFTVLILTKMQKLKVNSISQLKRYTNLKNIKEGLF
jgi:nucleoside diphosphate kinase